MSDDEGGKNRYYKRQSSLFLRQPHRSTAPSRALPFSLSLSLSLFTPILALSLHSRNLTISQSQKPRIWSSSLLSLCVCGESDFGEGRYGNAESASKWREKCSAEMKCFLCRIAVRRSFSFEFFFLFLCSSGCWQAKQGVGELLYVCNWCDYKLSLFVFYSGSYIHMRFGLAGSLFLSRSCLFVFVIFFFCNAASALWVWG